MDLVLCRPCMHYVYTFNFRNGNCKAKALKQTLSLSLISPEFLLSLAVVCSPQPTVVCGFGRPLVKHKIAREEKRERQKAHIKISNHSPTLG